MSSDEHCIREFKNFIDSVAIDSTHYDNERNVCGEYVGLIMCGK